MEGERDLRIKVEKHDQDLYRGNGKPGITTRMAVAEKEICDMKEDLKEYKKDSKQIKLMVLGVILTVIGEIIVKLVAK